MNSLKLIVSEDGSHTLFNPQLDETYHSIHGAIQESNYVFIDKGLAFFHDQYPNLTINILEVGLGTGLNILLANQWAEKNNRHLTITSLEKYPLASEITDKLNYAKQASLKDELAVFSKIHSCAWGEAHTISDFTTLTKHKMDLVDFDLKGFNLIFFDAFAPSKQAELWTPEIFKKIADCCTSPAVFVTYCAKGQVRRDLRDVGFTMERLQGPPGKHEMLRGVLKKP